MTSPGSQTRTVPVICPCGPRAAPCLYPACVEGVRTAMFQASWAADLYPPVEASVASQGSSSAAKAVPGTTRYIETPSHAKEGRHPPGSR